MASPNQGSTFYMTPEEDARIRKTVKDRLQKCREVSGQERTKNDPQDLHSAVTMASLMADMNQSAIEDGLTANKDRPDAMPAFAVGTPYPPCILSVVDLEPMKLSELRLETHHRGRVLKVRRDDPVVTLKARSWTAVTQEGEKDAERLEIVLHKSDRGEDFMEFAKNFYVKEPYLTLNDQNEPALRIDHPSDLIIDVNAQSQKIAASMTDDPEAALQAATKAAGFRKSEGNAALKQQEFTEAHEKYSEGLEGITGDGKSKTDLVCDLFRNRAHVNLALNRFDEAKSDAIAALSSIEDEKHQLLDSKAYFRAGCAAYNLGEYEEAKDFFQKQQKLAPGDRDAAMNLRKIETRVKENTTGTYDLKKIASSLSTIRPRAEVASFVARTNVKDTPSAGRGLFASFDIEAGQTVLCEKAFCVVWGHEEEAWTAMTYDVRDDRIRGAPAGLTKAIVQKLRNNPSQFGLVMDLFSDYKGIGKECIVKDDIPVIDTFQIHDIVARNAFGPGPQYGDESVQNASTGLWVTAAYINHSCVANAEKQYVGDLMVLRATRPIKSGDEIFHSYDESSDYEARSAALMNTWGFKCECALCKVEAEDDLATRKKRRTLEEEAHVLMAREEPAKAKKLSITKAKRLVALISETYDEKRYGDLPRKALYWIQRWLEAASTR